MISDKKIKQIRKSLRKGVPEGELIADLQEEGFSEEDIQIVFYSPGGENKKTVASENPLWYLISIALLILGITILLGPRLWLTSYAYVLLIAGLTGIGFKIVLKRGNEN